MVAAVYFLVFFLALGFSGSVGADFPAFGSEIEDAMKANVYRRLLGHAAIAIAATIGGYVGAVVAKRSLVLVGALSAWLLVASSAYTISSRQYFRTPWGPIVVTAVVPLFSGAGGYLRSLQRVGKQV